MAEVCRRMSKIVLVASFCGVASTATDYEYHKTTLRWLRKIPCMIQSMKNVQSSKFTAVLETIPNRTRV